MLIGLGLGRLVVYSLCNNFFTLMLTKKAYNKKGVQLETNTVTAHTWGDIENINYYFKWLYIGEV